MEKSLLMLTLVALTAYAAARYADSGATPGPRALSGQYSKELANQVENLRLQQELALARIADLEWQLERQAAAVVGSGMSPPAAVDGSDETVREEQPERPDRRLRTVERIEQAGLTVEEFEAVESRAYELYLDTFEQEWRQRREQYLAGERNPGSQTRLREELGDDAYDRYLFANGNPNRVRIQRVLPGSAAERAGLSEGDVLLSYGGEKLYSFEDLRSASYHGEPGEQVLMEVRRSDGTISQLLITRGPMGISGYGGWREPPGS